RPERGVEGVRQVVVEVVVAEARAEVQRPPTGRPAPPARSRIVRHVGGELGQEAHWVDLRPVQLAVTVPPVSVPGPLAEAVPTEGIELACAGIVQRQAEVPQSHSVLLEPVAPVAAWLRDRVALDHHLALAVDGVRKVRHAVVTRIGPRPIGRLAVEALSDYCD